MDSSTLQIPVVAPWRQLLLASLQRTKDIPESRYFQLASVDNTGAPRCRTLVFRELHQDNEIIIISDTRTEKFTEFSSNPRGQICWYFAHTREQYRFDVTAQVTTFIDNELWLTEHWSRLSDAGKKQFLWGTPGTPRRDLYPLESIEPDNVVPSHFCVISLAVSKVDYLNLRGNPQNRIVFDKRSDGSWGTSEVIP